MFDKVGMFLPDAIRGCLYKPNIQLRVYSVRNNGLFMANFFSRTVFPIGHFTQGGVSLCPGLKQRSTQLITKAFQAMFALIETLPQLQRLIHYLNG